MGQAVRPYSVRARGARVGAGAVRRQFSGDLVCMYIRLDLLGGLDTWTLFQSPNLQSIPPYDYALES